jgi:hypothetical protein
MKVLDAIDDALGRFRCRPSGAMGKSGQYYTAPLRPESQPQPGAQSLLENTPSDLVAIGTTVTATALSPMHPVSA